MFNFTDKTNQKDERYYQAYLSHHVISRRHLFRGILGGTEKHFEQESKRLATRPPFAAPEHLFVSVCNGCGDCVAACPNGVLQIVEGKVTLDLGYSSCSFCGHCADACSQQALHRAFPADTELRPIFLSSCIQNSNQACECCQQACPQQAISSTLQVDPLRCNGCGECQLSCFVSAITLTL